MTTIVLILTASLTATAFTLLSMLYIKAFNNWRFINRLNKKALNLKLIRINELIRREGSALTSNQLNKLYKQRLLVLRRINHLQNKENEK